MEEGGGIYTWKKYSMKVGYKYDICPVVSRPVQEETQFKLELTI